MLTHGQVPLWAGARGGAGGRRIACMCAMKPPPPARYHALLAAACALPLTAGCIVVSCSAFLLLLLERRGARWLEALFGTVIGSAWGPGLEGRAFQGLQGLHSHSFAAALSVATPTPPHGRHAHQPSCCRACCACCPAVEAVAMAVNFFRAGVPAKEVALGEPMGLALRDLVLAGGPPAALQWAAARGPALHGEAGSGLGAAPCPACAPLRPPGPAGLFVPTLPAGAIVPAVGALGALVMPYNLYFASAIVQSRWGASSAPWWSCCAHRCTAGCLPAPAHTSR